MGKSRSALKKAAAEKGWVTRVQELPQSASQPRAPPTPKPTSDRSESERKISGVRTPGAAEKIAYVYRLQVPGWLQ